MQIDVTKPAMSTDDIEMAESDINKKDLRACIMIGVSMLICILTEFVGKIKQSAIDPVLLVGFMYYAVFIIFSIYTLKLRNNNQERKYLEEVEENECADLHDACLATPEGVVYRQAVIDQGRRFIVVEYLAIKAWAKDQSREGACRRLYGIEEAA